MRAPCVMNPSGAQQRQITTLSVFCHAEPNTRSHVKNDDYQRTHDEPTMATDAPILISNCVMGQQIPPCAVHTRPTAYKQYYHVTPPHE